MENETNFGDLVEEIAVGKMKTTVEEMLQDHLEKFTTLILMEECTSKQCYVRVKKLSHKQQINVTTKQKSSNIYKDKERMPKKKINSTKSRQKQLTKNPGEITHVSCLTLTIPKIRKKSHRLIEKVTKKDCLVDEILNDPGVCTTNCALSQKSNNSLERLTTKPVIIPFRKRKRTETCTNNFQCYKNETKVQPGQENGTINAYNQNITLAEYIKDKPISCPDFRSSLVPFSTPLTPLLRCTPHILNIHPTPNQLKRWGIDWNKKAKQGQKKTSLAPKWKERWSVKRKQSQSGGLSGHFNRPCPGIGLKLSSRKIPVIVSEIDSFADCHPFKPITDQELDDGLPDIFDFDDFRFATKEL
jgi:hypothetical protein